MKRGNRQAVFFVTVICLTLLTLFILRFEMTGYAAYFPTQIQSDWCNGSDINRDGKVDNSTDFSRVYSFFNKRCTSSSTFYSIGYWCNFSDINRDGEANSGDGFVLEQRLGRTDCIGLGGNLIPNPDFEIDSIYTNGKTIPFFWNKNSEEQPANVKYNIVNELKGKVASIEVNNPFEGYIGIKTNPIPAKANTMYSLKGLIACYGCAAEDFKLFLHVKPSQGTSNFNYSTDWEKTTGGYTYSDNYEFIYNLYEINFTTNDVQNLSAYVIAAFRPNKTGTGYVGNLEFKEINITCTKGNADLNGDRKVNDADLAILGERWTKYLNQKCIGPIWCECADINQDGKVSVGDQIILGNQYANKTCSELNGDICSSDEECPENNWINALDSDACCKTTCTAIEQPTTPSRGTSKQYLTPSATSLKLGYSPSKPLKKGDKIEFSIDATAHIFEITTLSTSAIRIKISSNPIEDTMSKGQTRKFELTGDHYYDLKVELNDITTSGAKVTLTTIEELITSEQQTSQNTYKKKATVIYQDETGEDLETGLPVWVYVVIVLVAVIVFVAVLLFIAHKRRQRYETQ